MKSANPSMLSDNTIRLDTIESSQILPLLEGHFAPEEAREHLMSLILDSLQRHGQRDFSQQERFGMLDTDAKDRIEALTAAKNRLIDILGFAEERGLNLKVVSDIKITVVDAHSA